MLAERAFKEGSLCVVGNINRDIKTAPLPPGEYLFRDGESSVPYIAETIGGGGANSAFIAASLGAAVTFFGRLGVDALGERLERTLKQHGIDSHLARDKAQPSGTSLALAFNNGHRHFLSCLLSCQALTFKDIDLKALTARRHLFRADVWFSEAMLQGGNLRLFRAARRAGMDISLDVNWDPHWNHANQREIKARKLAVRAMLPWVNLVHGNVRELTTFAEAADLKSALRRLVQWGAEGVVVHMGEEGAGYFDGDSLLIEPPAKAKRQIHVTGTGDVLSTCMMLLHRHPRSTIRQRLQLANKMVAQFIEGKRHFIPTLSD